MNLEEISAMFGLMIIPFTLLFTPKILFDKKNSLKFFIGTIILSLIALLTINHKTNGRPNFYLFLFCPLYALALLKLLLFIFKRSLHRNPKNSSSLNRWGLEDDEGWDKLFYFTFMLLSFCLPFSMLAVFYHK